MKLIGWLFAGISAVTATTFGVVSLTKAGGGIGDNVLVTESSAGTGSVPQSENSRNNSQSSASSSVTRARRAPRTINESLDSYSRCRKYTIKEKCLPLVPEGFKDRDFLI